MIRKIYILNQTNARSIAEIQPNGIDVLEELIAEEGMKLTQNEDTPLEERVIASKVMLGRGRSSDDWIEITQEEADKILKEQEIDSEFENLYNN